MISPAVNPELPSPPLKHVLKHHIFTSFKYLQGCWLNHTQPVSMLENPLKIFFLISNLTLPWHSSGPLPFHSVTCYRGEETGHYFVKTSFHVVIESHEVPPEPSFFSGLNNPGSLSHSSLDLCSRPFPKASLTARSCVSSITWLLLYSCMTLSLKHQSLITQRCSSVVLSAWFMQYWKL